MLNEVIYLKCHFNCRKIMELIWCLGLIALIVVILLLVQLVRVALADADLKLLWAARNPQLGICYECIILSNVALVFKSTTVELSVCCFREASG